MTQNQYETIFILTPVLSNEDVQKQVKKYTDFIKDAGGEIVAEEHWGLKQLAYEIKNMSTGIYHLVEHKSNPDVIQKMNVDFKRDDNVIRELTTKLDKYSIIYNDRRRKGEVGPKRKKKEVKPENKEA